MISQELDRIIQAKEDIRTSILQKGVTVPSNALIDDYDTYISNIPSGGGSQDLQDVIESDIVTLNIPSGTSKIGEYFQSRNTSLTSVTIPNSVTLIDDYAFYGCTGLSSVTIGSGVNEIKTNAFSNCTSLPEENNISYAGNCAVLVKGNQTTYAIKDGTRLLKDNLFAVFSYKTNITSITIPNSLEIISQVAFQGCTGLTSVTIPNSVITIGQQAFQGCTGLTGTITIPDSVTSIGNSAFQGCNGLTSVIIGSGVTTIGNSAFSSCTSLTSVTLNSNSIVSASYINAFDNIKSRFGTQVTEYIIGNGITAVGKNAFNASTNLQSITFMATTPPTLENVNAFQSTNNCPIYVPAESVSDYQSANNWSSLSSRIQTIPTT